MIAFFDTSVHIPLLSGAVSWEVVMELAGQYPVRLSPIVASELLRGISAAARGQVESLISQLLPLEPPSWRRCWYDTGRLLPRIFPHHETIGLGRLQNDCLIALTARHTGSLLVAADRHFAAIRHHLPFTLRFLEQ
jgi:predicted nucleic acid-binding protein